MQLTGVDIMLDENTFKSTYQIIKELSEVWENLSDVTQANVTGLIAGKRNANVVQALMTNFDDAENAMQTAMNSAGSAFKENEKYLDSIAGKIDLLKSQFQALSNGVIGGGTVKGIVDIATAILKLANTLNRIHLLLPTIAASASFLIGRGMAGDVTKMVTQAQLLVSTGANAQAVMSAMGGSIAGLSASQRALLASELEQVAANETLSAGYQKQISQLAALIAEQNAAASASQSASASMAAAWAAIPAIGKVAMIATVVISILQMIIPALTQVDEKAIETANDIITRYDDAEKTYASNMETIEGLRDRFNELSKGVDDNGKNINLTKSEYEEYQSILSQLIDISPGIVTSYTEQGTAVVNYKNALSDAVEKQKEFIENEHRIKLGQGEELFEGKQAEYYQYAAKLGDASKDLFSAMGGNGVYGGHSLGEVFSGKLNEQQKAFKQALKDIGATEYLDKLEKYSKTFSTSGENNAAAFAESYDDLRLIYENWNAFKASLRNSGQFTEKEIQKAEDAVNRLAGSISAMNDVDSDLIDYFMEDAQDQDWYSKLPIEALDEFRENLASVIDMGLSFDENREAVRAYGAEFKKALDIDASKGEQSLRKMAEGLSDGEGNVKEELEAYNAAVEEYINGLDVSPETKVALRDYFLSLTDSANTATQALDNMAASSEGLKDAMDSLKSGYDLLDKARSEMAENEGLSNDTVRAFQDALEDGEKLTDYIYAENGALKLNEEAWEARSRAMSEQKLDTLYEQQDKLQKLHESINTTAEQMVSAIESIDDMVLHETLGEILEEKFDIGNVDLLSRPILSGADMLRAGYNEFADALDDIVTLYSSTFTAGGTLTDFQFKDENGVDIPIVIDVTPVDANGNALSESELHDYLTELFEMSSDAFGLAMNDMEGKGLILNIEELVADETGKIDWDSAINAHEIWAQALHSISAAFEQANLGEAGKSISEYLYGLIETAWNNPELESQMMSEVYTVLDLLGKALAAKGMPELSEALSGLDLENIINGSKAVDSLTETINLVQLLETMLSQAGANADPLNLVTMFSNLESIGGQASTLVKALEDLDAGNLQNWMDLVGKYPELANIEGLFDIDTIEGQKSALMSILDEYEVKYDEVIQKQIDIIQAAKDEQAALEPEADLSGYDALIANLQKMKSFTLSKIFGTKQDVDPLKELNEQLNTFSTAVSNAQSAQSVLDDIAKGEKNDVELLAEVIDLAKKSGRPLEDFLAGFDGTKINFNTEAIEEQIDEFLGAIQELEDSNPDQYGGLTERVKQLIGEGDVEEPLTKLEDAMSRAEKIIGLVKDVEENGVTSSTIKTLQELFGEDWERYLKKGAGGEYTGILETMLEGVMNSELSLSGATSGLMSIFQNMFKAAADGSEETKNGIDALTDSISGLKNAMSLLGDIQNGKGDPLSMLDKAMDIAKNVEGIKITDLISFDESGGFDFSGSQAAIRKYIDSLFGKDFEDSVKAAFPTMSDAEVKGFVASFKDAATAEIEAGNAADELKQSLSDLSNQISNASSAGEILKDIASGEKSDLEIFQEMIQLADAAGKDVWEFVSSYDANGINWNLDAIKQAKTDFLDVIKTFESTHAGFEGITEYFSGLMDSAGAADTFSDSMSRIKSAMDLVRDSINNGMSLDLIEKARELFGKDWGTYFETDKETGELIGLNVEKVHEFIQAEQEASNIGGAVGAQINAEWEDAANGIEDATSALDEFSSALSQVQSVNNLLNSMQNGTADFNEILNGLIEISKNGNIPLENLLTIGNGTITWNTDAINTFRTSLLSLDNLKTVFPNITEEGAATFRAYVEQANEAAQATELFSNALSATSKVKGFVEDAKSGNADFASMLQTASELAKSSGRNISDFLSVVDGEVKYNTQAAINWLYSLIDGMKGVNGVTPEMVDAWKQSAAASVEANAAYQAASDGLNNVFSAIKSSVSGLGLNNDQITQLTNRYKNLANFDPSRLFEKTGNGIHLNTEALMEYESAFEANERAMTQSDIDKLVDKYAKLTNEINNTSDASRRSELFKQRDDIATQIDALEAYLSQLDALNSKYNKWQQAQSAGEEGDMYDNITGGLEHIKELYDKNLIGTREFKSALELMAGIDTTGMSSDDLRKNFEESYPKMKRWFTDGDKGARNFVKDLESIGMAVQDANGNWTLNVDIEKAAEELGTSTDVIEAALLKLKDYNWDIDLSGYGSGIEAYAADIDTAIEKIEESKATIEEGFQAGEIDTQTYVDAMTTLNEYEEKLKTLQNTNEGPQAPEPVTLEEAIKQIDQLQKALDTLANANVEIPVTITGDKALLESLLGGSSGGEGSDAGTVTLSLALNTDEYDNFDPEFQDEELHVIPVVDGGDNSSLISESATLHVTTSLNSSESDGYQPPDKIMQVTTELNSEEADNYEAGNKTATLTYEARQTNMTIENESATVVYGKDTSVVDSYQPSDKNATAQYDVDDSAVTRFSPSNKSATVNYKPDFSACKNAKPPTLKGKVKYDADTSGINKAEGTAHAIGTAHANGTAFRSGRYALKHDVIALSGEIGPELVVRDGRFFTVGNAGAEFFKFKSGDIIFNASQTNELLRTGLVRSNGGRGIVIGDSSAYATGTAFVTATGSGSFPSSKDTGSNKKKTPSTPSTSGKDKGTDNKKSDDSDWFDWIEVLIDRIEASIKSLARTATSTFKTLKKRIEATNKEIKKVNGEITTLEKSYKRYIKQADSVNLSEGLKKKVRNGTIDITKYSGDKLDKIKEYQEWYEKALDVKDKIDELKEDVSELYQDKFEATQKDYENKISRYEHQVTAMEKDNEARQYTGESKSYKKIREYEQTKLKTLNKEAEGLQKKLDDAVRSGAIKKYSEAWYEMKDAISKVNEEAKDTAIAIAKSYKDAFDDVEKSYSNKLGSISNEIAKLNNNIAASEYSGTGVNYEALREQEQRSLNQLNKEATDLRKKLNAAVDSGKIAKGSDVWYEMQDAIAKVDQEAQQTAIDIAKSYKDAFDYVEKKYQNSLSAISHDITRINNEIAASEYDAKTRDYAALRKQQENRLTQLNMEADALQAKLNEAVQSGKIAEGSDAWYDMKNAIASTREEAQQTATEIAKSYKDAFSDVESLYKNKLSAISNEISRLNHNIAASEYSGTGVDYSALRAQQQSSLDQLNGEVTALQKKLSEAVNSGKIKTGSDAWYDMKDAIAKVSLEAQQTATEIARSYKDAFDYVEKQYKNKLALISHSITEVNNQIAASVYNGESKDYAALRAQQQKHLDMLNKEAAALQVKLDEAVRSGKIKEGSNTWYEMKDAIASAREEAQQMAMELAKSYKDAFDAVENKYSDMISNMESKTKALQNGFSMIEARGYMGGMKLYEQMAMIERQTIDMQQKKLRELESTLNDAVQSGRIVAGSETWYAMKNAIDGVKTSIQEAEIQLIEYDNKIRSLNWSIFDYLQDRVESITDEADFLIELLERSDLFDDNGTITDAGNATLGLRAVRYNAIADQVRQYADAVSELNSELAKSPNDTELIERRETLLKLQRDSVLAAENEKKAVADLVEEGIDLELKALKELIDKYNDTLSSAKDLYDYQKKVSKQADSIATLQKQIAAYSGDMSEETRAKLQKLQVELKTANEDLQEMQYDQYINDQKTLLNNLYDDYEEILNSRLDDVDALMTEIIETTNNNADSIRSTIESECRLVGITLTDVMNGIWSTNGEYSAVVTTITNGIPDQLTTVIGALSAIANRVASIVSAGDNTANGYVSGLSGFAQGGFVSSLKKAAYRNGDNIVTINSLKEGEAILTAEQAAQFKTLVNHLPALHSMIDVGQQIRTMSPVTPTQSNIDVGGFNMTFQIDHVQDYNDLVRQMRNDKTFERMIQSITLDPLVGKSTLARKQYYNH